MPKGYVRRPVKGKARPIFRRVYRQPRMLRITQTKTAAAPAGGEKSQVMMY